MAFLDLAGLAAFKNKIIDYIAGQKFAKSVNGEQADNNNNINLTQVPFAVNLVAEDAQKSSGTFIQRPSGGTVPVGTGEAWLNVIQGNSVKTGYVEESLSVEAEAVERPVPPEITAELDSEIYASVAGENTTTFNYLNNGGITAWDKNLETYGVTVSNTPWIGDKITVSYSDEEYDIVIDAVERIADPVIEVSVDRDTFVAARGASGNWNTTLTYTTSWGIDLSTYGITVTNIPIAGDKIIIDYVKEVPGTISSPYPTGFVSTGWNLYNKITSLARVVKYSDDFGYKIKGAFTQIDYSTSSSGPWTEVTDIEQSGDGWLIYPETGFLKITGGDETTTCIWRTMADWTENPEKSATAFEVYTESVVSISNIMNTYFQFGLASVGSIRDEINLNTKQAIQRINRIAYSAENLATIIASEKAYDYDSQYIYYEMVEPVITSIEIDGTYDVCDHGLEFFTNISIPVYAEMLYGQNLKDKLRTDVLTISQQTLSSSQKTQARNNIDAISLADVPYGLSLKSLDENTNLNTIINPGSYCLVSSRNYVNSPIPSSKYGLLYVYTHAVGANRAKAQIITSNVGTYFRAYSGTNWTAWSTMLPVNAMVYDCSLGTAPVAIQNGKYLICNNKMYCAKTDIASGETISTSNATELSAGALNRVVNFFTPTGYYTSIASTLTGFYDSMVNTSIAMNRFGGNTSDAPNTGTGMFLTWKGSANYGAQLGINDKAVYYRKKSTNWSAWGEIPALVEEVSSPVTWNESSVTKADCTANLYKCGKIRMIKLSVKLKVDATAYTTVCTVASGHRPKITISGCCGTTSTTVDVRFMRIQTNGSVDIRSGASGSTYYFTMTYLVP